MKTRKLKIEITIDNAAFGDRPEAGRILRKLADTVDDISPGDWVPLRDINGNIVGKATVTQ